jgi:branched-subunit amino acid aminotransferase/4-amino-4-deoxychorismate lyase
VPEPDGVCWLDGTRLPVEQAALPVSEPALLGGLGLFETMALRGGRVLELPEHLERLARGAERLALPLPPADALESMTRVAAAEHRAPCGWLKLVLTGGGRLLLYGGDMRPEDDGAPATAILLPWRRNPHDPLSGLKSLSNGANLLGLAEARRRGADEGLWLNVRGRLAEGCTSNLFLVQRNRLFTPGTRDGILPGVTRALVLRIARQLGLHVHEGRVRLERLERAHEAFLTSSLRGVRPLVATGDKAVGSGRPGAVTRRIAEELARRRSETA